MERKQSFDSVAELYAAHRPAPPEAVFDAIAELAVAPPAQLLEIAPGPGTVTLPLAQRGYRIHAVELGEHLAQLARERLAGLPFTVEVGAFETAPLPETVFDLCVCASAFHWLDRSAAYPRIARAVRPGGALVVLWTSMDREAIDPALATAMQEVYEREAPDLSRAGRRAAQSAREQIADEVAGTVWFERPVIQKFRSTCSYGASGYLSLLATYSDHIVLARQQRDALFQGIAELIERRFGGRITVPFVTELQVARRRE